MSTFRRPKSYGRGNEWQPWFCGVFWTVVVCAVIAGVVVGTYHMSRAVCRNRAVAMGREWRVSPLTPCMIQDDDGRWVPLSNWRQTRIEQ